MGAQDDMLSVLAGPGRTQPRPPQVSTPMRGIVKSIGSKGVMFTMPDFDDGAWVYGPAKWNKGGTAPPVGAECVIVFLGLGLNNPWAIAWWT